MNIKESKNKKVMNKKREGGRKKKTGTTKTTKTTKTKTTKGIKKNTVRKTMRGGTNIDKAAVDSIKSMINLGKSIGNEIDAIFNMGRDFNRAANVNLPNQTTPDQGVTSVTSKFIQPKYPTAKV
jgi:hypothetical protein